MTTRRLLLASGIAASLSCLQPAALAQSRPIRLIVPFGAGGVADLTARAVAQKMAENMGQSIVIENKPGAGGVVAAEAVAHAEPDGNTLLLMSNAMAVSTGLFKSLPFNARRDFAPVSLLGLFDLAIVVPGNSRFQSLAELLAWGQDNPGRLNIGTIAVGSTQHLAAEWFNAQSNLHAQIVPFNGTPAVITALRGGQVDAAVEILGPVKSQLAAKAMRALAVLGESRPADLPGVIAARELPGLSGINVSSWNALAAPARTAPAVLERLNREVAKALQAPEVRKRLADLSVQPRASSPEQLARLLDGDIKRWSAVIQRAGIPRQ